MTRRAAVCILLAYLGVAVWTLVDRLGVFAGRVASEVEAAMRTPDWRYASATDGIDFIECMGGCAPLPGAEGVALGLVGLLLAGTPLGLSALVLRGRLQYRTSAPGAGLAQQAFVLQAAATVVSGAACVLLVPTVSPADNWRVVALTALSAVNLVLAGPALVAWRQVYGRTVALRAAGATLALCRSARSSR
jgi:hypothetical protein